MHPENEILIPYIYNVFKKDPSKISPINVINSKIPQQRVLNIILCINNCACDLPNRRNYLMTNYWELNRAILAGLNEGNMTSL